MPFPSRAKRPRRVRWLALWFCGAVALYAVGKVGLQPLITTYGLGQARPAVDNVNTSAARSATEKDVPNSVVSAVARHVGVVPGLDELVVLPRGNGYLVSATVNLSTGDAGKVRWTIARDVQTFFTELFASNKDVVEGELSFLSSGSGDNGEVIASAGLGRAAYQKLSVSAMGGDGIQFTDLMSRSQADHGNLDDCWFEVDVNQLS
ncbi:hypothetical protein [Alicyclobacillus herbarius]|uniref:hypothetical protein n=1 Tax=Alicyclobacillus herbarius TaxID=122960 RepID=UPI0012DC2DC8|nr:hypothetical protein [Alicyclobacillus herbarius]